MKLFDEKAIVRGGVLPGGTEFLTDGYIIAWAPKGILEIGDTIDKEWNKKYEDTVQTFIKKWKEPDLNIRPTEMYDIKNFQTLCRIVCRDIEKKTCYAENCLYNYLLETPKGLIGVSLYLLKCLKVNSFAILKSKKLTALWRGHPVGGILCWEKDDIRGVIAPVENLGEKLDNEGKQFFTFLKLLPDG